MKTEILNEIGFSDAERKVYIILLELGLSKAAPILKKTGLQNSVLYRTIHRLIEKGFVSFIKEGKVNYYKATKPEVLMTYLKEKEKRLKKLIPKLKLKTKHFEEKEVVVYSGFNGLKTMLYSLVEDAKKGEKFFFFGAKAEIYQELEERVYHVYKSFLKEKGLIVLGINHVSVKPLMKKQGNIKLRYTDLPIPKTMVFFQNNVVLIAWNDLENPIGVVIKSEEMAEQYKKFFKEMWKISKPL